MSFCALGAKANDNYLQIPHSTATDLTFELSYLRNHSAIIKARLEAETALSRERKSGMELKLQVKHQNILTDELQSQIETLLTERASLQANKSVLGKADFQPVLVANMLWTSTIHVFVM